jgi:uncharacterized protein DUF4279
LAGSKAREYPLRFLMNEAEVYFALCGGDFDPDVVTHIVGVPPTLTRRKGTPASKYTEWKISSGKVVGDVVDVYELSSALVSKLLPYQDRIAKAKEELGLDAVLQVVLWITTDESKPTPAIGFESEVITFLNAVGASIDSDTYRN